MAPFPGFMGGDEGRIDAAHLAGTDADERSALAEDDGVRLHMLADPPRETKLLQFVLRRFALGGNRPFFFGVGCFVTLRDGQGFGIETMQEWLAKHAMSKVKWPERLEIIDAMPMTPTRKVMKGALVKELERRRRDEQQQQQ